MQGRHAIKSVQFAYFRLDQLAESLRFFQILFVWSPWSYRGSLAAIRVLPDEGAAGDWPKSKLCDDISEFQEGIFVFSVSVYDDYYRRRVIAPDPAQAANRFRRDTPGIYRGSDDGQFVVQSAEILAPGTGQGQVNRGGNVRINSLSDHVYDFRRGFGGGKKDQFHRPDIHERDPSVAKSSIRMTSYDFIKYYLNSISLLAKHVLLHKAVAGAVRLKT
jgi:hypothetical protein